MKLETEWARIVLPDGRETRIEIGEGFERFSIPVAAPGQAKTLEDLAREFAELEAAHPGVPLEELMLRMLPRLRRVDYVRRVVDGEVWLVREDA